MYIIFRYCNWCGEETEQECFDDDDCCRCTECGNDV